MHVGKKESWHRTRDNHHTEILYAQTHSKIKGKARIMHKIRENSHVDTYYTVFVCISGPKTHDKQKHD
jgi:hypothetical protein